MEIIQAKESRMSENFTKTDMVDRVLQKSNGNVSKKQVEQFIESIFDTVTEALSEDKTVRLGNLGSLKPSERKARSGRNPQTGQQIQIPAKKVVKFNMSKALDEQMNS